MRRWLALFLLALLPLQSSWAVVAAYCGHDAGQATAHLGHHEHQHADGAAHGPGPAPADGDAPADFDFDCSHCHGTCASLPAPTGDIAALSRVSRPAALVAGVPRSLAPRPPERPQWARLA